MSYKKSDEIQDTEDINVNLDTTIGYTDEYLVSSLPKVGLVSLSYELHLRLFNNVKNCDRCNSELIKVKRLPPSLWLPLSSSNVCAGVPYQKVYCGPRCFFPMGILFGYIPFCCDGCFGYCGCLCTPMSVLCFPLDCLYYSLGCCELHNYSQRRMKCNHPQCKRLSDYQNTCCSFGTDASDMCTGYYPPLEFDEYYYQCPSCTAEANVTVNCFQTKFDIAKDTITNDLCKDCAFLPLDDDIVLNSNTYADLDGELVPVLALKRKDDTGNYDIRRNHFGIGKGQQYGNIKASNIYQRIINNDEKLLILKEIEILDGIPSKYLLYCFSTGYNDESYPSPSTDIKSYALMMDSGSSYPRKDLKIITKINIKIKNINDNNDQFVNDNNEQLVNDNNDQVFVVTFFKDLFVDGMPGYKCEKSLNNIHFLKCTEN